MLITSNIKVYTGIISQQYPHEIKNTNTQIKVILDWTIEELNEGEEKVLEQPHNFHVTFVLVSQDALNVCHPPPKEAGLQVWIHVGCWRVRLGNRYGDLSGGWRPGSAT